LRDILGPLASRIPNAFFFLPSEDGVNAGWRKEQPHARPRVVRVEAKKFLRDVKRLITGQRGTMRDEATEFLVEVSQKLQEMRELKTAKVALDAAARLKPRDKEILTYRGMVKWRLGMRDAALADADYAVILWPREAFSLQVRALIKQGMGQLQASLADLNEAHHLSSGNHEILWSRADVKMCLGRPHDAISDLDLAQALVRPLLPFRFVSKAAFRILTLRAAAYLSLNLHKEALADLEAANALMRNNSSHVLYMWGAAKVELGKFEDAIRLLERAKFLRPRDPKIHLSLLLAYGHQGKPARALSSMLFLKARASERPEYARNIAGWVLLERLASKGLKYLDVALETYPNDAVLWKHRGDLKGQLGMPKGALEDLNRSHELRPDDSRILISRALVKFELGMVQEAVTDLKRAKGLLHGIAKVALYRGMIDGVFPQYAVPNLERKLDLGEMRLETLKYGRAFFAIMRKHADALRDLPTERDAEVQRLLNQGPTLRDPMRRIEKPGPDLLELWQVSNPGATYQWRTGQGLLAQLPQDPRDALQELNRVYNMGPDDSDTLAARGIIHMELGMLEAALVDLDAAAALQKPAAAVFFLRGLVYCKLRRYREALADLDAADALQPDNAETLYLRGVVKCRLLDLEEAARARDEAPAADAPSFSATDKAYVVHSLGPKPAGAMVDEAVRDLERAVALEPECVPALYSLGALKVRMEDWKGGFVALWRAQAASAGKWGRARVLHLLAECEYSHLSAGMALRNIEMARGLYGADNAGLLMLSAMCKEHIGERREAREDAERAVAVLRECCDVDPASELLLEQLALLAWDGPDKAMGAVEQLAAVRRAVARMFGRDIERLL
jgi:tetratricopeptide (TPR) repeat protein